MRCFFRIALVTLALTGCEAVYDDLRPPAARADADAGVADDAAAAPSEAP